MVGFQAPVGVKIPVHHVFDLSLAFGLQFVSQTESHHVLAIHRINRVVVGIFNRQQAQTGQLIIELRQLDYELPSLRLLPIEYPDYNSIDSVDSQNVMRFGLRNKLQTKRQGQVEDVVNWDLYTDWRLKPDHGQTTFADLFSDLVVRARSWLKLESLTRFA